MFSSSLTDFYNWNRAKVQYCDRASLIVILSTMMV